MSYDFSGYCGLQMSYDFSGYCQIQIQNIFIEHNTWVYIGNQEYETQMGLFNSRITKHHIVVFDLSFALEKTNWVSRCR